MGLIEKLASENDVAIRRIGSVDLVPFEDVERILDAIASARLQVLGIEGFRLADGGLVPDMDSIADFSSGLVAPDSARAALEAARTFFRSFGGEGMWYEFVLAEDE